MLTLVLFLLLSSGLQASGDDGVGIDPDGRTKAAAERGVCIDPDGAPCVQQFSADCGSEMDPNG